MLRDPNKEGAGLPIRAHASKKLAAMCALFIEAIWCRMITYVCMLLITWRKNEYLSSEELSLSVLQLAGHVVQLLLVFC